jgi:DNA-binding response OmpR family regulator
MKVLVIEDDPTVRDTLGMVLESYEHQAALVDNARQAIASLKESWPDVILLDLTLPEMTGEQVYEEIFSEFGRTPPTVVLSAAAQGASRARHLPGALFLAKPYTIEQLEEIIHEACGRAGAA